MTGSDLTGDGRYAWVVVPAVSKEMRRERLSKSETARIEVTMKRVAERAVLPSDFKKLRDQIYELRVDGHDRTFRLLYSEIRSQNVLLGVHFFSKKSQKVPKEAIDVALARLTAWQRGQGHVQK